MRYVGLDIHKNQTSICLLDENGKKVFTRTVRGSVWTVLKELKKIKPPFSVCFEASTGYGLWYEQLSRIAAHVLVGHPGHLRLIFKSKRKNDRIDAEKLAKLLYLGAVSPVYVPPPQVRAWRSLIEFRNRQVRERTRAKNRMRALLRSHGLSSPTSLWTRKGLDWLAHISFEHSLEALKRDMILEEIVSGDRRIKRVEKELKTFAKQHPQVALLQTIPGVGIRTAEAVAAYVDDPARFRNNKTIGSYFGLVPCLDASADVHRYGHITKEGPSTVRRLLIEASWQGIRHSPRIKKRFEGIKKDNPERRKIALVATAHYLARVMLAMLATGEVWRPEDAADRAA
jgi:transposase